MTQQTIAQHNLDHGSTFPFDASDAWWNSDETRSPPPATDWAHAAVRGIMSDLQDRRGIKRVLELLDEEVRVELTASLAEIIRLAEAHKSQYTVAIPHHPV